MANSVGPTISFKDFHHHGPPTGRVVWVGGQRVLVINGVHKGERWSFVDGKNYEDTIFFRRVV